MHRASPKLLNKIHLNLRIRSLLALCAPMILHILLIIIVVTKINPNSILPSYQECPIPTHTNLKNKKIFFSR